MPRQDPLVTYLKLTGLEDATEVARRTRVAILTKMGLYYVPANETSEKRMRGQGFKEVATAR